MSPSGDLCEHRRVRIDTYTSGDGLKTIRARTCNDCGQPLAEEAVVSDRIYTELDLQKWIVKFKAESDAFAEKLTAAEQRMAKHEAAMADIMAACDRGTLSDQLAANVRKIRDAIAPAPHADAPFDTRCRPEPDTACGGAARSFEAAASGVFSHEHADAKPAGVTDEMVDRAVAAWNATKGHPHHAHLIENRYEREQMRAALAAAPKQGAP